MRFLRSIKSINRLALSQRLRLLCDRSPLAIRRAPHAYLPFSEERQLPLMKSDVKVKETPKPAETKNASESSKSSE
jgi:hypothetical protein